MPPVALRLSQDSSRPVRLGVRNILEGPCGPYLVNRFAGGRNVFERPETIFRVVVLAGTVSTLVRARPWVSQASLSADMQTGATTDTSAGLGGSVIPVWLRSHRIPSRPQSPSRSRFHKLGWA
jgi:hypothetical protein